LDEHASALHALDELGPDALPALRQVWEQGGAAAIRAAARGLGMLGAEAAPLLLALLRGATSETRQEAIRGLLDVLPRSLQVLLEARQWAGEAGNQIDAAFEAEGPTLLRHLRAALMEPDPSVRRQIVSGLGRVGSLAEPELAALLSDPDVEARLEATRALGALRALGSDTLAAMKRALELHSIDEGTAELVIETLARQARVSEQRLHWGADQAVEAPPEDVNELQRMLRGDSAERSRALLSLAEAGSSVHPWLYEPLAEILESSGSPIAADLLRKAGGRVVPALRDRLILAKEQHKNRILKLLGEIAVGGPTPGGEQTFPSSVDGQALLALIDALRSYNNKKRRRIALAALEAIGPVAIPALSQDAGSRAAAALTRLEKAPKVAALATLMQIALRRWPPSCVRHRAIRALTTLDQVALPALEAVLYECRHSEDRTAIIEAIGTMGAVAVAVVANCLSNTLYEESELEIVGSLGRIGEAAVPVLSRRLLTIARTIVDRVEDRNWESTDRRPGLTARRDRWLRKRPERAKTQAKAIFDILGQIARDEVTRPFGRETAPADGWQAVGALGQALLLEAAEMRNQAKSILRQIGPRAAPGFFSMARSPISAKAGLAAGVGLVVVGGLGSVLVSRIPSVAKSISHEQLHLLFDTLGDAGTEALPALIRWVGSDDYSDCKKVLSRSISAIVIREASAAGELPDENTSPVLNEAVCALAASAGRAGRDALADAWERAAGLVRPVLKKALSGGKVRAPVWVKKTPVEWASEALQQIKGDAARRMLLEAFRAGDAKTRREIIQATNQWITSGELRIGLLKEALYPHQDPEVMRLAAVGLQEGRLADSALEELKEALWFLDVEVCRQAAVALSKSNKGQLVLSGECHLALRELISMRKELFRERAISRIEEWLSRPEVNGGEEAFLGDLLDRLRDSDKSTRQLIARLAPTDQELIELLQPRGTSTFGDALKRMGMAEFAAEAFALHERLVEALVDWGEIRSRLDSRRHSVLLRRAAGLTGPHERFVLFHENREYQLAVDAVREAHDAIEMTHEADIERYLDCLGHLGRKEEYWDRLGALLDHPRVLHKRRDVSWAAFCRRAVAAVGWVRVGDPSRGTSSGTAFCVSLNLMLTCRHVLEVPESRRLVQPDQVRVLFPGGDGEGACNDSGPGRKVLTIVDLFEGQFDAVLLRIDHPLPAWFRFGYSGLVERGDEIAVLGYSMPDSGATVDHNLEFHGGKLSNFEPITPFLVDAIKVGVEVGPGMSGAPVCNDLGEAIGILTLAKRRPMGGADVLIERLALLVDPVRDVIAPRGRRPDLDEGAGRDGASRK